jgi:hypothetical protein
MSSTYTTSMATVSFVATTETWAEQSSSEINVIGYPGGDAVAVSISGQRETTRTFKALLSTVADYRTMLGMRARVGGLFVENWDSAPVNAILQRIVPDPILADGKVYAQVQFILY